MRSMTLRSYQYGTISALSVTNIDNHKSSYKVKRLAKVDLTKYTIIFKKSFVHDAVQVKVDIHLYTIYI